MSADNEKRRQAENYTTIFDIVALLGGGSVVASAVQTLIGSSAAFGAGLHNANLSHAALSSVQLSALTDCLVALRRPIAAPVATAATAGYIAGANALPPGAPVVT